MSAAESVPKTYGAIPLPLQDGEMILQFCRRHWWFLWPWTVVLALTAVVPVLFAVWFLDATRILDDLTPFFWFVALAWFGYWAVRAAFNWYRYINDIWIVTNQRIIDSFKPHPFNHRLATADLVNVQDISVVKVGIVATMLKFGDVLLQTAAAGARGGAFCIAGVPNPETIQLLIDRERDRERMRLSGPGTATTL